MNCLQFRCGIAALMTAVLVPFTPARAAEEPDLIFKRELDLYGADHAVGRE